MKKSGLDVKVMQKKYREAKKEGRERKRSTSKLKNWVVAPTRRWAFIITTSDVLGTAPMNLLCYAWANMGGQPGKYNLQQTKIQYFKSKIFSFFLFQTF